MLSPLEGSSLSPGRDEGLIILARAVCSALPARGGLVCITSSSFISIDFV